MLDSAQTVRLHDDISWQLISSFIIHGGWLTLTHCSFYTDSSQMIFLTCGRGVINQRWTLTQQSMRNAWLFVEHGVEEELSALSHHIWWLQSENLAGYDYHHRNISDYFETRSVLLENKCENLCFGKRTQTNYFWHSSGSGEGRVQHFWYDHCDKTYSI